MSAVLIKSVVFKDIDMFKKAVALDKYIKRYSKDIYANTGR